MISIKTLSTPILLMPLFISCFICGILIAANIEQGNKKESSLTSQDKKPKTDPNSVNSKNSHQKKNKSTTLPSDILTRLKHQKKLRKIHQSSLKYNTKLPNLKTIRTDPKLRKLISQSRRREFYDSDGYKNDFTKDYNSETPLVEFAFVKKELDGSLKPMVLSRLEIRHKDHKISHWLTGRPNACIGLRLEISDANKSNNKILFDKEYYIKGIAYAGSDDHMQPQIIPSGKFQFGQTNEVKVKIPKSLEKGQIYRIELLLVDKIERKKRWAKEEAIREKLKFHVTVLKVYHPKTRNVFLIYNDGVKNYSFAKLDEENWLNYRIENLGGDLTCYIDNTVRFAAKNIMKRKLKFPEDSDIFIPDEDFSDVEIYFEKPLKGYQVIGFYDYKISKHPLFCGILDPNTESKGPIEVKAISGNFIVKAMPTDIRQPGKIIGKIKIGKEKNATYTISKSSFSNFKDI